MSATLEAVMAYDGELVKMQNGRWARFQRTQTLNGVAVSGLGIRDSEILVAVELDDASQSLLDAQSREVPFQPAPLLTPRVPFAFEEAIQ